MSKINNTTDYASVTPVDGDLLIGTDVSNTATDVNGETVTFLMSAVKTYALGTIEDGADVTDTANVTAAGALMDSEVTNLAQVKAFASTDYATAAQGTLADTALQPTGDGSGLTGIAAGVEWTRKTAIYTAVTRDAIIADTSAGAWTLTLPATPTVGDYVQLLDGADWATNNLTVARNGSTIEGSATDLVVNVGGISVDLVFDGTTWQVTTQAGGQGGDVVTLTGTQTLTNKTLSSATHTGVPTAPTAAVATNTTQLATTAFVLANAPANPIKAWVNFNGTGTVAINGSLNVSSITDNGGADYTVNFASALANANYAIAGMIGNTVGGTANMNLAATGVGVAPLLKSTTQVRIYTFNDAYDASVIITGE